MNEQTPDHSRPAWLISVLLHVCLLLAVALLGAVSPAAMPSAEPDRPASIVLRQLDPHRELTYLDSLDAAAVSAADSGTAEQAEQSEAIAEALPPQSDALLAEVLPTESASVAPSELPSALAAEPAVRGSVSQLTSDAERAAVIEADLEQQRRRAAGRPQGPPAEVSLFGSPAATGHRFAFVIDRSQSMGSSGLGVLEAADGQLATALKGLEENHQFQIIAYNDHLAKFPARGGMQTATEPLKQQALAFVKGLAAFRGTDHGLALLSAAHTEADVIFLLTDGDEPGPTPGETRRILSGCAGRATIHALQFGFGPVQEKSVFMQTLAQRTGGVYHYVDIGMAGP